MKPSDILEASADYIEKHGWAQGSFESPDGAVCAANAISVTEVSIQASYNVIIDSMTILSGYIADNVGQRSIFSWNDDPKRTKQEVLDTFRKAAKLARIEEERD